MENLNFCGFECPQPVIETKKFLDNNKTTEAINIIVDNKAASENVSRFLTSQGFTTVISPDNNIFQVTGSRTGEALIPEAPVENDDTKKSTTILIANRTMGAGNLELGEKLMVNFIKTLPEIKDSLWRLIFVNEGVKLTIKNSGTLPVLQELERQGVTILVCGTCLEFFNLMDDKMTGETTNMLDIITSLQVSDKVINL